MRTPKPLRFLKQAVKPMGLVFGDIGTSPLYTIPITFTFLSASPENAIGIISLVIWTLFLLVTVGYGWNAMSLSMRGEGGTIVLKEILIRYVKAPRMRSVLNFVSFVGISLIIGDAVITPAISILSAVEGARMLEVAKHAPTSALVLVASCIAIGLFSVQRKGTDKVTKAFGPIMVTWFLALAVFGVIHLIQYPHILQAYNPLFGIRQLITHQGIALFILSSIFLCATGAEAMYADMGHLGRKPILNAWYLVLGAILLNYLGQGAYVALHHTGSQAIFGMVKYSPLGFLYVPFLILSILATIIASQALISGMFSIVYQAISTRILPLFKVDHTSPHMKSQIYIGTVNWFLLACVVGIMWLFKTSESLGAAYGFSVSGTMIITSVLMLFLFTFKRQWLRLWGTVIFAGIAVMFFAANSMKIPNGGYWSVLIASLPFSLLLIYNWGQKQLQNAIVLHSKEDFITQYLEIYQAASRIRGTALYFTRDVNRVPPYVLQTMTVNHIIYEHNVFISIIKMDQPFGLKKNFKPQIAEGLSVLEVFVGYMDFPNLEKMIKDSGIDEKAIFYGVEEIVTDDIRLKIFAVIKRLSPSFVQFYQLPANKVHGVVTRLEM